MAKTTEQVFHVVSSEDITAAMLASGKSTAAGNVVSKQDGVAWAQTVVVLMERVNLTELVRDTTKDGVTKLRNHLIGIMSNHILASATIPEEGKNRQGKTFKVSGTDGVPKWSSWDQTRRIWSYIGDVAKILSFGQESALYPEKFKVASRCDVLSLCKNPETTLESIERLSSALQEVLLPLSDTTEVHEAHLKVSALTIPAVSKVDTVTAMVNKIDALLGTCSPKEVDEIAIALSRLTKYFSA